MNASKSKPFFQTIENLVHTNELVLFGRIEHIEPIQEQLVVKLLEMKYGMVSGNYPHTPPAFDEHAALWSSKILFHAAQLVMYRQHDAESLSNYFPQFPYAKTASAILTADLSLRFVPGILSYLEQIDVEDELIPILKKLLKEWHYSGLLSQVDLGTPEFSETYDHQCLLQLYVDRVIEQKQKKIGQLDKIKPHVLSVLGTFEKTFWKNFNSTI